MPADLSLFPRREPWEPRVLGAVCGGDRDEDWWGQRTERLTIYEGNGVIPSIKD